MRTKLFLFFLLTFYVSTLARAYDFGANGLYYNITGTNTVEVTYVEDGEGNRDFYYGSISIPKRVSNNNTTYNVTRIGDDAFTQCYFLTSITIPESVTSIGNGAFDSCEKLTSITIPEGVTSIGHGAFICCSGLTSITIPEGVTSIGNAAFNSCSNLTSVTIPEGLTSIGARAFSYCSLLSSVVLPSTLQEIGSEAFASSCLSEINLPSGLQSLGEKCFQGCHFVSVTIPSGIKALPQYVFRGCENLESVVLPRTIEEIGDGAFQECPKLSSINFPFGLKKIEGNAFQECKALESIDLPYSLTEIGSGAFMNSGLKNVEIPYSVETLGTAAFKNTPLASVLIPANTVNLVYNPFQGCNSLTSIVVDNDNPKYDSRQNCNAIIETATNILISGCPATKIPSTVTCLGEVSFNELTSLTEIDIPEGVEKIQSYALTSTGLTALHIPASVSSISPSAIQHDYQYVEQPPNTRLTTIDVASGNKRYDSRQNCNAIIEKATNTLVLGCESTVIPASVTKIGYGAFMRAYLTEITLPYTISEIGEDAFFGCEQLRKIVIGQNVKKIAGTETFMLDNITEFVCRVKNPADVEMSEVSCPTATLYVPLASVDAYKADSRWKFKDVQPIVNNEDYMGAKEVTGRHGGTVTIPVTLNNAHEYGGIQCEITLPEGATLTKVTKSSRMADGHNVEMAKTGDNTWQILAYSTRPTAFTGNEGTLFTLTVSFDKEMADGDYNVTVEDIVASRLNNQADDLEDFQSKLVIDNSPIVGDANDDGRVTVADIMAIANYILKVPSATFNDQSADASGDGRITVADIMAVANIILKVDTSHDPE